MATCNSCGSTYHLNQREDLPGKDCGQVWINEDHMALEFACQVCLEPPPIASGGLDDVLGLAEAAETSGLPEDALLEAVRAGALAAKKISEGVYIFERQEVLAFAASRR